MQYLVKATNGPTFSSPEEAVQILEKSVLPSFSAFIELKSSGRILAGGLPVAGREMAFIAEADSNEDLDQMLRDIPLWPLLTWDITPLQSFEGRAQMERDFLKHMKKK